MLSWCYVDYTSKGASAPLRCSLVNAWICWGRVFGQLTHCRSSRSIEMSKHVTCSRLIITSSRLPPRPEHNSWACFEIAAGKLYSINRTTRIMNQYASHLSFTTEHKIAFPQTAQHTMTLPGLTVWHCSCCRTLSVYLIARTSCNFYVQTTYRTVTYIHHAVPAYMYDARDLYNESIMNESMMCPATS